MTHKDYYTVLGVAEDASPGEIKRKYRDLAKKNHPDRNPGDEAAEARFKEIQEAYDVLGEPEKRKKYDDLRRFGAGGGAGINFEDLFGGGSGSGSGFGGSIFDLFERAGMGGRAGPRRPVRGEDLHYEVKIPFEQAAFGGKTTVSVPRAEGCATCGGSGAAPGTSAETCSACGGRGTAAMEQGAFSVSRPCPKCYGRGRTIAKPCPNCSGSGTRTAVRRIEVMIPAGVGDGSKMRLKGEGAAGPAGTAPGDLILTIRVAAHQEFRRDGLDVESDLVLDIAQAALGVEVEVSTLQGKVDLKVPAGIQPGAKLRLKGRGIRDLKGRTGNHFVRVRVQVPRELTEKQRHLLEEFREAGQE